MVRTIVRWILALTMMAIGASHFFLVAQFAATVPSFLPLHVTLVYVSGVCEILGGAGLLFAASRRAASWGLILLYVAVFPANLNMALHPQQFSSMPPLALWMRLPFQLVFIALAWWCAREPRTS